jgi:mono/diheme cytochrome c family protein
MLIFLALAALAAEPADLPGKRIYHAKCQACHGHGGKGDGPAARAMPKPPKDMTSAAFWTGLTDERLSSQIRAGKPGSAMRGFPMKPEEMTHLLAYLRTFEPTKP